ncbi:MAG: YcnI family protein [Pseudomonadota bacterium]
MRNKLILSALLLSATPAMAHVVIANPQGKAASTFIAGFRVGHGCAGSPTTTLTVTVPESIITARPQPKAGWTLSMTHAKLAAPVAGEGGPITERVSSITWTGGVLPADQYDEFVVMLRLPDNAGVLNFPVLQSCQKGAENWAELPDGSGKRPAHPAASLTVTAKDAAP